VNAQTLVAKVWNFAHVLRDQGVSDLVENLETTLEHFRNVAKALGERLA
jgi:hypothetical protein